MSTSSRPRRLRTSSTRRSNQLLILREGLIVARMCMHRMRPDLGARRSDSLTQLRTPSSPLRLRSLAPLAPAWPRVPVFDPLVQCAVRSRGQYGRPERCQAESGEQKRSCQLSMMAHLPLGPRPLPTSTPPAVRHTRAMAISSSPHTTVPWCTRFRASKPAGHRPRKGTVRAH